MTKIIKRIIRTPSMLYFAIINHKHGSAQLCLRNLRYRPRRLTEKRIH